MVFLIKIRVSGFVRLANAWRTNHLIAAHSDRITQSRKFIKIEKKMAKWSYRQDPIRCFRLKYILAHETALDRFAAHKKCRWEKTETASPSRAAQK